MPKNLLIELLLLKLLQLPPALMRWHQQQNWRLFKRSLLA
jgi:hypothetical protein